ncbi:hypothetical protein DFH07DRAFT_86654 [Mycena maculata]|uniref:Uncharacterized protein n=1 Tax=Mycena maculata TaxID=230809 RepID=A0AAD7I9L7_9AGAR|nr:hypothetical protein DFH07DRAFT_86654 [Mycena maculata]
MSGLNLSLRHLPDLSDTSFSFQIPTDSADDLLHGACDDFLSGGDKLLASPASHTPLALSDLEPLPTPTASLPPPKSKSLFPTTRSNICETFSSQIAFRVPKPTSAARSTHPRPKPVSGENITPADRVESRFGPSDRKKFILQGKNILNDAALLVEKAGEDVSLKSGASAGFPASVDVYSPQQEISHPSPLISTQDGAPPTAATEELPPQNLSHGVSASDLSQQQTKPALKFNSKKVGLLHAIRSTLSPTTVIPAALIQSDVRSQGFGRDAQQAAIHQRPYR